MIYLKKFNNDTERSNYIKSNFVSPHLFMNAQNRNINYFPKYKRLDYISSTSTGGQYIDLGCHLMENTDDIKIDIKFNIRESGKNVGGSDSLLATLIGSQPEVSPWPGFVLRRTSKDVNDIRLQTKWSFTNGIKRNKDNKWDSKYLSYYGNTTKNGKLYMNFQKH